LKPFKEKKEKVQTDIGKMGANKNDLGWLNAAWRTLHTDPEVLRRHSDYIFHVHAKFYNMLEDCTDECMDYEAVVPVLQEIGYNGWLSSEYEGNRTIQNAYPVDSVEQVSRQHRMFRRMLGEA